MLIERKKYAKVFSMFILVLKLDEKTFCSACEADLFM